MKKIIFSSIFIALAFICNAQTMPTTTWRADHVVATQYNSHEIKFINNKIFIENVYIDGAPATLKFDTGNNQTLSIGYNFASQIGIDIEKTEKQNLYTATGKQTIKSAIAHIENLQIGDVRFQSFDCNVQNNMNTEIDLTGKGKISNYAGLMGTAMLQHSEVHLNLKGSKQTISILPTNEDGDILVNLNLQVVATVPFQLVRGVPVVNVQIGGNTYKMIFDTGAQRSLLDKVYENDLQAALKNKNTKSSLSGANGQVIAATKYEFRKINLGEKEIKSSVVFFSNLDHYIDDGIDGYLGADAVKGTRFSINFRKQIICFYK